jgi:hypothetical protein
MCCCDVRQCCCGCTNLKVGIIIWAIIDAVINFVACIVPLITYGSGAHLWGFVVVGTDIMGAAGANAGNTCLLTFWLIIQMIHIVFLFCAWALLPILVSI